MKKIIFIAMLVIAVSGCAVNKESAVAPEPWYPAVNANGDPLFAVFESRIPCGDCQTIKLGLALYSDSRTQASTTYRMARVYVGKGNDRLVDEGNWSVTRGTRLDPLAVVYRLDPRAPREFQAFWAIGRDILFILDQEMNPRVGDAGYGYALNRTR